MVRDWFEHLWVDIAPRQKETIFVEYVNCCDLCMMQQRSIWALGKSEDCFFYVFLLQVCKMWLAYNMWNFLFCLNAAVLCCIWIEVNRWIYLKEHMHSNSPVLEKCLKGLSWANCGERMWPFANSSPLSNILAKNLRLTLSQKKLLKFFLQKLKEKKILQVKQSFFMKGIVKYI